MLMKLSDVITKVAVDAGLTAYYSCVSKWMKIEHPDSDVKIHIDTFHSAFIVKLPTIMYSYKDYRRAEKPDLAKRSLVYKPFNISIDLRTPGSMQSLEKYFLNVGRYLKQQQRKITKIE